MIAVIVSWIKFSCWWPSRSIRKTYWPKVFFDGLDSIFVRFISLFANSPRTLYKLPGASCEKEKHRDDALRFADNARHASETVKIKNNVFKNINKLKENNKSIIGYGAPAKSTTALNFFGITNQLDYIVEDNKLKHNKFIPGVKIPIFSKKKLRIKIVQF